MSCESQKRKHEEMEHVLDSVGEKTEAVLFLVQEGIQGKRFQLMKNFAAKNGFQCEDQLCERYHFFFFCNWKHRFSFSDTRLI